MIFVYLSETDGPEKKYILQLILSYLEIPFQFTGSLNPSGPADILITDRTDTAHPRQIVIDSEKILALCRRLTLMDEKENGVYDVHGRLESGSLAGKLERTEFHDLADEIRTAVERFMELPPRNVRPAFFLTHDVDKISNREPVALCGMIYRMIRALMRLDFCTVKINFKSLCLALSGKNTFWNFEEIMQMEDRYSFRSAFYFLLGRKGIKGSKYNLDDVEPVIRKLHRGGWEIGLHVNYYEYDKPEVISKQREALENITGSEVTGCRVHWLRFDPEHTFEVLEKAGFKYDTTLGCHDGAGFRTGAAYPYRVFDPEKKSLRKIMEIPLIVMDVSLFEYAGLNADEAWKNIKKFLDRFENQKAVITVLWHTNVFEDPLFQGWKEVYSKLLEYISRKGFKVMTGRQICEMAAPGFPK